MKLTYVEEVENKVALNRNRFCICGQHGYDIVRQIEPATDCPWTIRCPDCGAETNVHTSKALALFEWEHKVGNVAPKTHTPRAFMKKV